MRTKEPEEEDVERVEPSRAAPEHPSPAQRAFARLGDKRDSIAHALDVSPQMVSRLAHGRCRPSLDLAIAIAAKFGVEVAGWAEDVEAKPGV